jgi:hypothetical protein
MLLTGSGTSGAAQTGGAVGGEAQTAKVTFSYERPGMTVPRFTLTIAEDASGVYRGEEMLAMGRTSNSPVSRQPFERTLTVSRTMTAKIFVLAREANRFTGNCNAKAKNLADMGRKTLSYDGPGGPGSCTYNYADAKSVSQLTEIFLGIASTMDQGRELEHLHRYDRLGLDAALGELTEQVAAGRALELETIAATLEALAADADVMVRVRTRANALLLTLPGAKTVSPQGR